MADYLDLIKRRMSDAASAHTTSVELLVDQENYQELREKWKQAKAAADSAKLHLAALEGDENTPKTRMNQKSPVAEAKEALESAQDAEEKARAEVQACFIRVHVCAPSASAMAEVAAKAGNDQSVIYDLLTRRCVAKVTGIDGALLPELTADIIADYLAVAPVGERLKVNRALDKASTPIDFPM